MKTALTRLNARLRLGLVTSGLAAFALIAFVFGVSFQPQSQHALLQDILDPVGETRYSIEWTAPDMQAVGALNDADTYAYEKVLRDYLSGKLEMVDGSRLEDGVPLVFGGGRDLNEPPQSIPLRSRVRPILSMRNKALAVFEVETDALSLTFDTMGERLNAGRLETRRQTVRIAQTGLGLTVRHVEALADPVAFKGDERTTRFKGSRLAGFNYYPASAPWDQFWTNFPETEIRADFERMKQVGVNSVRVFVNRSAFETTGTREISLARLETLLDIADTHEMKVILTCFDFGRGYNLRGLSEDWTHLDGILRVVSGHNALGLIDLKNEPDLDFEAWGAARVEIWLSTLMQLTRATYPDLPLTIGWSNATDAERLVDQVDVVSFHDYEPAKHLSQRIDRLTSVAAGKPVMLTEIGHSKWGVNPFRASQLDQFNLQLAQMDDLEGVFVWTLNDFDHVPSTVAGWRPWRKAMQAKYGLSPQTLERFSVFIARFIGAPTQSKLS